MPVRTSVAAIFGATVVFLLEGLCRAEALMVQTQSLVDTCHRFTKKILVRRVTEGIRVPQWNQQHQIMQHGGLAGVRWTPPPTCRWPTRAPLACCLARQYRPSTGEQTGLPNTDTASGLPGALICATEVRSALLRTLSPPKSRPSCFVIITCTYILHSNNFCFIMCTMDVVSCKISKCMYTAKCNQPKFELRFAPQCFILYFSNFTTVLQRLHPYPRFCIGFIIECCSPTCKLNMHIITLWKLHCDLFFGWLIILPLYKTVFFFFYIATVCFITITLSISLLLFLY